MPTMTARGSLVAFAAALLLVGGPRPAAAQYPVFDAHIHYSRPDWDAYPPERALALLARAGVRRALVSSTPDDGTLKLYERAPTVVVPFLRPYRTREDMGGWHADAGVAEYVEERLKRGIYRGIGEFHLGGADVDAPVVRRIAELAAERDLFLHAHVDADTIEKLLARYPKVRVLWAHAGMSADARTVGRLLDRFPKLWVELALRSDVAPGGRLDPEWRARFLRHADRFMVGTDTWVTSRWEAVESSTRDVQEWLAGLPAEGAAQIARGDGARVPPAPAGGAGARAGRAGPAPPLGPRHRGRLPHTPRGDQPPPPPRAAPPPPRRELQQRPRLLLRHTPMIRCDARPSSKGERTRSTFSRSEERRVGKECRSRWSPYH